MQLLFQNPNAYRQQQLTCLKLHVLRKHTKLHRMTPRNLHVPPYRSQNNPPVEMFRCNHSTPSGLCRVDPNILHLRRSGCIPRTAQPQPRRISSPFRYSITQRSEKPSSESTILAPIGYSINGISELPSYKSNNLSPINIQLLADLNYRHKYQYFFSIQVFGRSEMHIYDLIMFSSFVYSTAGRPEMSSYGSISYQILLSES